tara:strand:- start:400 stop:717 length:318 start_codon:yes stop_codon:yes gene_type:complete
MKENDLPQSGAHDVSARTKIKNIILGFFVVLGVFFFCASLFISVYIAFFPKPPIMEFIIADGRKLYNEMKEVEKQKEKEAAQKTADDESESQFLKKMRKRVVNLK